MVLKKSRASNSVGKSTSSSSSPWYLWCSRWYFLNEMAHGTPIGKLTSRENMRLCTGRAWPKAKLWEISWIAKRSAWLMTPPMVYAAKNRTGHETPRSRYVKVNWIKINKSTWYLKFGSYPINFLICGYLAENKPKHKRYLKSFKTHHWLYMKSKWLPFDNQL